MIRKAGHELVLYYNPEVSSKVMKLKGVLVPVSYTHLTLPTTPSV